MDGPPDGGYGWIVLTACIVCQGIAASLEKISGLIVVHIINTYHVNRTQAFTVLVTFRLFGFMFAPIVGKLYTKFPYRIILFIGCFLLSLSLILTSFSTAYWHVVMAYGCMRGIANICVVTGSNLSVGIYFEKRRSLAMGIHFGAMGIAGFIAPLLFYWLEEIYEFHGAMLILGGLTLHGGTCAMLVRQPSWMVHSEMYENSVVLEMQLTDEKTNCDKEKTMLFSSNSIGPENYSSCKSEDPQSNIPWKRMRFNYAHQTLLRVKSALKDVRRDLRLYKDGHFLLLIIGRALSYISFSYFISLLPDYMEYEFEQPTNKRDISYMLSVCSIGEIIARFGTGLILDKLPWRKINSLAATLIMMGIIIISFQFMQNYIHFMYGTVLYGLWAGMYIVMECLVEIECMGPQRLHIARGLNRFTVGIFNVCTGFLIGYLRDQLGSYEVCIAMLGGSSIAGGLLWIAEPLVIKCFPLQEVQRS